MRSVWANFGISSLLFLLNAEPAQAAAWLQDKGHGQLIVTGLYYSADEYFNNSGDKISQPTYSKYEINPYAEYGLRDNLTIGANILLDDVTQDGSPGRQQNAGLGDSEFFARTRLWHNDWAVVSAQPFIKIPGYDKGQLQLGGKTADIGGYLSAGASFKLLGLDHFADIDLGYRHRYGRPADQLQLNAALGLHLTNRFLLLPQMFLTQRAKESPNMGFTQSSGDDYDLMTLQLSGVYEVNPAISVQLGGFTHADGENVGAGDGFIASVWTRF